MFAVSRCRPRYRIGEYIARRRWCDLDRGVTRLTHGRRLIMELRDRGYSTGTVVSAPLQICSGYGMICRGFTAFLTRKFDVTS